MNKKLRILITIIVIVLIGLITIDRLANSEVEAQLTSVKLDLANRGIDMSWEDAKFKVIGTDLIVKNVNLIKDDFIEIKVDEVIIDMIDLQNEIPQFLSVEIINAQSPKLFNNQIFNINLNYEATDDNIFTVKKLNISSSKMFEAIFSGTFTNVILDNNLIENWNSRMSDIFIEELNLEYSDYGMINRIIETILDVEDGDTYRDFIADQVSALTLFSSDEELNTIFSSISRYLKNPETIVLYSKPDSEVSIDSLLNFSSPSEYIGLLNLTIQ